MTRASSWTKPLSEIRGAVEVIAGTVDEPRAGSPHAVLQAMRALPNLNPRDVDELERMIEAGNLATHAEGAGLGANVHQHGPPPIGAGQRQEPS